MLNTVDIGVNKWMIPRAHHAARMLHAWLMHGFEAVDVVGVMDLPCVALTTDVIITKPQPYERHTPTLLLRAILVFRYAHLTDPVGSLSPFAFRTANQNAKHHLFASCVMLC